MTNLSQLLSATGLYQFFKKLLFEKQLEAINELIPRYNEKHDLLTETIKSWIALGISLCFIMMKTSPDGWAYASFLRPLEINVMLLHRMDVPLEIFATPESGMHWFTLFIYLYGMYFTIVIMEKQGINKPMHKIIYSFGLFLLSFFVPFEFVYVTLYDIFHNIPRYGKAIIWKWGWWNTGIDRYIKTIMFTDIVMSIGAIILLYYIYDDLKRYYDITIRIDKISKVLFVIFILGYVSWVLIPVYQPDLHVHGTNYFPQTIYVDYGFYEDYGIDATELYGVVSESFHPNMIVKYHNHFVKLISLAFMVYTFTPRKIRFKNL